MSYFSQLLHQNLLQVLSERRNILEIGGGGQLQMFYSQYFEAPCWSSFIDWDAFEKSIDKIRLGEVAQPRESVEKDGKFFDAVILHVPITISEDAGHRLEVLHAITTPDVRFLCNAFNSTHVDRLAQVKGIEIFGDFFSLPPLFKAFLDAGWSPNLLSTHVPHAKNAGLLDAMIDALRQQGIPESTAKRYLLSHQFVLDCRKEDFFKEKNSESADEKISVIVPVNDEKQFSANILASPGLLEIDAQIIVCRNMHSAAQAWGEGKMQAQHQWVMLCHQDVYFPKGFGKCLSAILKKIPMASAASSLIGFAGLGRNSEDSVEKAGYVIDRSFRFESPESAQAVSIDEFAVVMARETSYQPDQALGWHLWATDLCLQASMMGFPNGARLIRAPVFHNSHNDGSLNTAFTESLSVLFNKYPQINTVPTLCGTFSRA